MINFNLAGDALVHCLKVSGARIVLVDKDDAVRERIANERLRVEELGMKPIEVSERLIRQIALRRPFRPEDSYREGVTSNFPAALFYTR